ncbi:MAG: HD domain-containing protein, partial [Gammaproteobacteria bacterium]|nr:HD domain-containing protein [Gammaproteobacteria bacterium]
MAKTATSKAHNKAAGKKSSGQSTRQGVADSNSAKPQSRPATAADKQTPAGSNQSYFVSRLAENAKLDTVASPATITALLSRLESYLPPDQVQKVAQAHAYAEAAHEGQMRRTGHPYITHPLAVANILAGMRMDPETVIAALLHDVMEDTGVAKKALSQRFGNSVAE